jgi:hypothetical protein
MWPDIRAAQCFSQQENILTSNYILETLQLMVCVDYADVLFHIKGNRCDSKQLRSQRFTWYYSPVTIIYRVLWSLYLKYIPN